MLSRQAFSVLAKNTPMKAHALPYLKTDFLPVAKACYQKLILAVFI